MRRRRDPSPDNFYEIFSDMALLMLAAFIFLFALILVNAQLQGGGESELDRQEVEQLREKLAQTEQRNKQLQEEMNELAGKDVKEQMDKVLASAGLSDGKGKRDFDMFIQGLKDLPGNELHLVVDATGSMHGVTTFLIPVLRVIAIRSGKHLSGVSWYADLKTGTFTGSMGAMFDNLMQSAPFVGSEETVGHAFRDIAKNAPIPSAYMLIGDEPPTDSVGYHEIPAPVFTLPLGINDSETIFAYKTIAEQTGGKMLKLNFQ
ncbi:MAG: hypothetical protein COW19_04555 [Zetaproteobacteria bacterium CG12_big_fil_rev_8_21_14_0_65_55_1124]|nr:MAG: hypothetical protein AUJ58_07100 [Zetaproteobacteria bacterium CG1_02_55_237]PIS20286.1 MAG: hypothetical protein COT53_01505 [Zetaproteobacteria bacterium CG08_land_8_20_14_0_20_55_17]PIW43162.1 MAG: hypothetical protein COW19_04555 [Zetaproteobacteria bacterium CG12_big_fil_rev_8_21_14_0_65_55_1124]PIY52126.1 MAG: hypothetical protein COZ01_09000 [Zetaproteobacteria bacterium CG_4_10_14_0_8_um_filter_55_43]PIZ38139.1 MAG: hypothetical protein COY36_07205 [Zetaproteobacteria bacterium 